MSALTVWIYVYHARPMFLVVRRWWRVPWDEFWIAGSHHVGTENRTQALCKSSKCSQLLRRLSSPKMAKFILCFL